MSLKVVTSGNNLLQIFQKTMNNWLSACVVRRGVEQIRGRGVWTAELCGVVTIPFVMSQKYILFRMMEGLRIPVTFDLSPNRSLSLLPIITRAKMMMSWY